MVANNVRYSRITADRPNLISRLLSWWKRRQGAKSSSVTSACDGGTGSGDDRQRLIEGSGDLRSTSISESSVKTPKQSANARPESSASSDSSVLPPGEEESVTSVKPPIQKLRSIVDLLVQPFKWRKKTNEYKIASVKKAPKKRRGSRKTRKAPEYVPMQVTWSPFDFGFTNLVTYPYPKASMIHYPCWHKNEWYWPMGRQSVMRVPRIVVIAPSEEAAGVDAPKVDRRSRKKPPEPERLHIRWQSRSSRWEKEKIRRTNIWHMEVWRHRYRNGPQPTLRI